MQTSIFKKTHPLDRASLPRITSRSDRSRGWAFSSRRCLDENNAYPVVPRKNYSV